MAGYPKIWTFIRHELWFKSLKANERGAVLEMLLMVKEQQDNGHLVVNSMSVLALELSINRKTLGKLIAKLTNARPQKGETLVKVVVRIPAVLVIINQQPLDLYFPKYLKWQQMTVSDAVKHAQASGVKVTPYHTKQATNQSIAEASNVDNSREENPDEISRVISESLKTETPTDQVLYTKWCDFRERNPVQLEALAINYQGVPAEFRNVEFFNSVIEDLELQIKTNPEKFKSANFMAILKGFLKKQSELGKLGPGGMTTPITKAEEDACEDEKRLRTREFKNGSGVEI